MANARQFKIPDGNGGFNSYPIEDVRDKRTRRDISSDLANLTTAIAEQNLEKYGYKIGDYFDGPTKHGDYKYRYILADMNTFNGGYNLRAVINTNHITIVVDTGVDQKWHSTANDTTDGYVNSNLHSYLVNTVLPNVRSDIIALFGEDRLLTHSKLFSTGNSAWAWSDGVAISALTSVQIHGSPVCDMNFYHTGEGCKLLEVFQKYSYANILGKNRSTGYQDTWLRSVASASCPCFATYDGLANGYGGASASRGVVGLINFH